MPTGRAHSLIVQSRLAISLAWVAGYVNTSAVLTCGVVTSHVTGHASSLGRDVAEGSWRDAGLMATLIGAFFLGALLSGFALEIGRLRGWASIYVLPAALELVLLVAFAAGVRLYAGSPADLGGSLWWMTVVAALAMGVQNATITRISSGVVRTTHLTGIVTDLGHEMAQLAVFRRLLGRGAAPVGGETRGPSPQRLLLLASILASFIVGSASGAWVYLELPRWSMLAPILLLCWIILADLQTPICEIEEAIVAEIGAKGRVGDGIALFRAIPRGGHSAGEAQLPDLTRLLERAGTARRTVIVDLSGARVLGPLAATAIHALIAASERTGHRVILTGLDADERATVNALSRAGLLSDANCTRGVDDAVRLAAGADRST